VEFLRCGYLPRQPSRSVTRGVGLAVWVWLWIVQYGSRMPALGGGVNVPGLLALAIVLGVMFLPVFLPRGGPPRPNSDTGSDGGSPHGPPRRGPPPVAPWGGTPLDDAEPAGARLRDHGRLADGVPARDRRPAREPVHPPVRTSGWS
jgi:hypothetical protein